MGRKLKPWVKGALSVISIGFIGTCTAAVVGSTSKNTVRLDATFQGCQSDTSCEYVLTGNNRVVRGPSPSRGVKLNDLVTVVQVGNAVQSVVPKPKHVKKVKSNGEKACLLESANGLQKAGNFGSQSQLVPCTDDKIKGAYTPMEETPTNFLSNY